MGVYLSTPKTDKESYDGGSLSENSSRFGMSAMQGWRQTMEDAHIAYPSSSSLNLGLYGVFDGHGGTAVAGWVARHFDSVFAKELTNARDRIKSSGIPEVHSVGSQAEISEEVAVMCEALRDTFLKLDVLMQEADSREEMKEIYEGSKIDPESQENMNSEAFLEQYLSGSEFGGLGGKPPSIRIIEQDGKRFIQILASPVSEDDEDETVDDEEEDERDEEEGGREGGGGGKSRKRPQNKQLESKITDITDEEEEIENLKKKLNDDDANFGDDNAKMNMSTSSGSERRLNCKSEDDEGEEKTEKKEKEKSPNHDADGMDLVKKGVRNTEEEGELKKKKVEDEGKGGEKKKGEEERGKEKEGAVGKEEVEKKSNEGKEKEMGESEKKTEGGEKKAEKEGVNFKEDVIEEKNDVENVMGETMMMGDAMMMEVEAAIGSRSAAKKKNSQRRKIESSSSPTITNSSDKSPTSPSPKKQLCGVGVKENEEEETASSSDNRQSLSNVLNMMNKEKMEDGVVVDGSASALMSSSDEELKEKEEGEGDECVNEISTSGSNGSRSSGIGVVEGEDETMDDDDDEVPSCDPYAPECCGATAIVGVVLDFLNPPVFVTANAGDSRAVLCRDGVAVPLSRDHKPNLPGECERILKAGGSVTNGRVDGNLNLSRSVGDLFYKKDEKFSPHEQKITAFPDVRVALISERDEFVILACDGIWDCLSNQMAVDFVRERLQQSADSSEPKLLSQICEEMCDRCLAKNPLDTEGIGCDNMTCMIVELSSRVKKTKVESAKVIFYGFGIDSSADEDVEMKSSEEEDEDEIDNFALF